MTGRDEGGFLCQWCDEPILDGERVANCNIPMHEECGLRSILGGINHLLGLCTCCGGTQPPDPPGLTRREAALRATAYWYATRRR